ncbi:hypothetical protein HPP92_005933 [Vanilla planifolia]|uniref:Uncharacterized protein n=1 Tax=Vanilla planifolia TaxID=51239 RepID=A0A835VD29_VANPL|nr:hypothetical protein HPP92_005933 [Vanilla planifolia]
MRKKHLLFQLHHVLSSTIQATECARTARKTGASIRTRLNFNIKPEAVVSI